MNHILKNNKDTLQNFNILDYEDDNIIDNDVIDKCIYDYFPTNKGQLKLLIIESIEKNPKKPYLLNIDTSKIKDMSNLFEYFDNIEVLDLSTWDTSNVRDMHWMFNGCESLKELDLSSFNTYNVKNMKFMFYNCKSLNKLNLINFNTINVENMHAMFSHCEQLKTLNISHFNTSNVINMRSMFEYCKCLKELNLSTWDTSNVRDMHWMFNGCESLKKLNIPEFDMTNMNSYQNYVFGGCKSLKGIHKSSGYERLNEDVQRFNTADYEDNDVIDQHVIKNMIYKYFPKNDDELSDLIEERIEENPKKPYLLDIDTSQIVYMSRLFVNEDEIEILDLSTWDTSNVTQMWNMFEGCTSLKKIIVSNWNTSNVISMDNMFERCRLLKSLDLSGWDIRNVTDMSCMFKNCHLLEELDLSGWNINNDAFIDDMFEECYSLKKVYTNDRSIKHEFDKFKKSLLNENANNVNYNFDIADYAENETDIIPTQEISKITRTKKDILINKVLTGDYNAFNFNNKEVSLWNNKICGHIIDDDACIGCYIEDMPYPYFICKLVNVNNIKKIKYGWATTYDEFPMVYTSFFNKKIIRTIMQLRKDTGKIGIFSVVYDGYYIEVIIDTDENKVFIYSILLAKSLGFNENDISKGFVIIDKNLRDLLDDVDLEHINGYLKGIDYLYIKSYEYKEI